MLCLFASSLDAIFVPIQTTGTSCGGGAVFGVLHLQQRCHNNQSGARQDGSEAVEWGSGGVGEWGDSFGLIGPDYWVGQ